MAFTYALEQEDGSPASIHCEFGVGAGSSKLSWLGIDAMLAYHRLRRKLAALTDEGEGR